MKLPVVLALIIALGIGFAAGSFFGPEVSPWMTGSTAAATARAGEASTVDTGNDPAGLTKLAVVAQPRVRKVKDLDALIKESGETFSFQHFKDITDYVDSLNPAAVPGVMKQLEASPDRQGRIYILFLLTSKWSETDPDAALAWSRKKSGDSFSNMMKNQTASLVYGAMAKSNLDGALAEVQQMPTGPKRQEAMASVIGQLAETDPAKALQVALGNQDASFQNRGGFRSLFSKWAEKDPAQATQALLQLPTQAQKIGRLAVSRPA